MDVIRGRSSLIFTEADAGRELSTGMPGGTRLIPLGESRTRQRSSAVLTPERHEPSGRDSLGLL